MGPFPGSLFNQGQEIFHQREFRVAALQSTDVIVGVRPGRCRRREDGAVRRAAGFLLRDYPRIDVLINSAGLHSTTRTTTRDGFETVFCVNHLAPFLLTHLLLERLRQSAPARIIQVNSEGHRFGGLDLNDLNWEHRRYSGLQGYGASKIAQLLTTWEFADRLPNQLSGGQQQRVAIGRALAIKPTFLLADEPTGNLDETTAEDVLALARDLVARTGCGLLMVTHSLHLAATLDRRVTLHAGVVT